MGKLDKYLRTILMSHKNLYLGCGGSLINIPQINILTTGVWPTVIPFMYGNTEEIADLWTLIVQYL